MDRAWNLWNLSKGLFQLIVWGEVHHDGEGMATSMNEIAAHIMFIVKKQSEMSTGAQFTFSFLFSQIPSPWSGATPA